MNAGRSSRGGQPHLTLVTANPIRTGGMQKFTRYLAETLLSANWRVTIALSGQDIYGDLRSRFRRQLAVEQVEWLDATLKGDRRYRMRTIADRWRWFRRVRPNVTLFVQSSNTPFRASVVGAWLAGVPIVTTHRTMPWVKDFAPSGRHIFGIVPGLGLHNRRQVFKTRIVAALASRIVYNSHEVRRCYERDYRYPRVKGRIIANAVCIPPPRPTAPRDEIVIGYVGRIGDEKQLDVLIRSVADLRLRRRVRLLVYGDGPARPSLAVLAGELGIDDRIQWCGLTDDVSSAYERMDIVALCSRRESSSNMVLEAMAAGKAVVVTDVGGLPELTCDGRWGVCVPVGDVAALTDALKKLVENDEERSAMGARAREAVGERHDPRMVGRAWLELLTEVSRPAGARAGQSLAWRLAAEEPVV